MLFVDADEIVSPNLAAEINQAVNNSAIKGYFVHRVDYIWGSQLKHGDVGAVYLLRLGQVGNGLWQGKVHETWNITGVTGRLKEPLLHYPHQTLYAFLQSINSYSDLRAAELKELQIRSGIFPIFLYPLGKFINLWVFKAGILDGIPGLIHALIMSFYSFLVRGKLYLLSKT